MNETRQHEPRTPDGGVPETLAAENQSLAGQRSRQDRVFGFSVLASLVVTLGWLAWVSNSDLFGSAATLADLHPQLIKIVKPPIPQKPKPKKKEPPPPPPKHQPPPKVKPLKPPPPRPRPTPPRPAPLHRVQVATTHNTRAVSPIVVPETAPNTDQRPTASGDSPQPTPPAPAPVPPMPAPPAPEPAPPAPVVAPPAPPPPAPKPPPPPAPKPEPPPRPRNYSPIDSQEAGPIGDFDSVDMPSGVDVSSLSNTSVVISYDIDEDGHATNIHVKKGSGNADLDDACKDVVRRKRFKPAIQDHLKLRAPGNSATFNVG